MDNKLNTAEYACRRRPTHEEIELARKRVEDPNILTGKDALYAFYKTMGMDVEYDEIFADWKLPIDDCLDENIFNIYIQGNLSQFGEALGFDWKNYCFEDSFLYFFDYVFYKLNIISESIHWLVLTSYPWYIAMHGV